MSTILVVDDDQDLRENITEILAGAGFEVRAADNGEEALEAATGTCFDLLLLDLVMPKMDGMEALPLLRRKCPGARIIMMTAYATVDNAVEAMRKGADDYITKPFKIEELLKTVQRNLAEARFMACKSVLDMDNTFGCLANSIRREILLLISRERSVRFMDIARKLGIDDHTKMNFHLKVLKEAGMIEQDARKFYCLSQAGRKVLDCLNTMARHIAG